MTKIRNFNNPSTELRKGCHCSSFVDWCAYLEKKKSPHELSSCNVLDYWPAVVLCLEISFSTEEKKSKGVGGGDALGCAISHCVKLWKWFSPNNCAQKMEVLMGQTRGWKSPLDNSSHTESQYGLFSQRLEGGEEQVGGGQEGTEREREEREEIWRCKSKKMAWNRLMRADSVKVCWINPRMQPSFTAEIKAQ